MRIAIGHGCRHYAPLLPTFSSGSVERADLPHEVLGVALLHGPRDGETFQAIRCGAMVLSDLGNHPEMILAAADYFGVADRLAHIARLGFEFDDHPGYWETLLSPALPSSEEAAFLPGLSRLTSETRMTKIGRHPVRTWLRTRWLR
ncbi:MAG TPA: hypothetical protein VNQ90_12370 [Chthoniobacteraceae bacterium]|nr:hypothetical protein [Chthoniobacteraceae bacterium]